MAATLCGPETMERLIDPIIADLQAEYRDAAGRGGWQKRTTVWRGYRAFWKALALHGLMRMFQPSKPESGAGLRRVLTFSAIAFALMTALMVAPPMIASKWFGGPLGRLQLILLLVPQALPFSIPMGVCVGIVCAMRGRRTTGRHVATVLMIAAVATFGVWTMLEWGMPAANQGFRETIATHLNDGRHVDLEPGLNELGLSRLGQRSDARAISHSRLLWAICFATPPIAIFALGLSALVRRLSAAFVVSFLTIVLYWFLMASVDEAVGADASRTLVAWLPNIVFAVAGALMVRYALRLEPEATR